MAVFNPADYVAGNLMSTGTWRIQVFTNNISEERIMRGDMRKIMAALRIVYSVDEVAAGPDYFIMGTSNNQIP